MPSAKTARVHRLIRVFAGRTCLIVGFVMRRLILLFLDKKDSFHSLFFFSGRLLEMIEVLLAGPLNLKQTNRATMGEECILLLCSPTGGVGGAGDIFWVWIQRGTSNEYPQHRLLWRNKKNYPRIIIKYSSMISPLILASIHHILCKNF